MNQNSKFKKLLKEEIKLILIQEGWKEKLAGYAGTVLTGLALGGLLGTAPVEGERSARNRERTEQATVDIIKSILTSTGVDSVEELNELGDDDFIAAVDIIIENINNKRNISDADKRKLSDFIIKLKRRLPRTTSGRNMIARLNRLSF